MGEALVMSEVPGMVRVAGDAAAAGSTTDAGGAAASEGVEG